MAAHTAAQGECIARFARQNGSLWETLWNHPADLRNRRKDPNVLYPGRFGPEVVPALVPLRKDCAAADRSDSGQNG